MFLLSAPRMYPLPKKGTNKTFQLFSPFINIATKTTSKKKG